MAQSDLRTEGYDDAITGKQVAKETSSEYMDGYREGLRKQLDWITESLADFCAKYGS